MSTLMQTTASMSKQELLKAIKEALSIGWENKRKIQEFEKKFDDMKNGQSLNYKQAREQLSIEEKFRQEMQNQIKQFNISNSKTISQTKDQIIKVMNEKIQVIENAYLEQFTKEKTQENVLNETMNEV